MALPVHDIGEVHTTVFAESKVFFWPAKLMSDVFAWVWAINCGDAGDSDIMDSTAETQWHRQSFSNVYNSTEFDANNFHFFSSVDQHSPLISGEGRTPSPNIKKQNFGILTYFYRQDGYCVKGHCVRPLAGVSVFHILQFFDNVGSTPACNNNLRMPLVPQMFPSRTSERR